jgi:gamma-glutamyl hercynylcysteine S-oxide synthase
MASSLLPLSADVVPAQAVRSGGAGPLALALQAARADTLATFAVYAQALQSGGLRVPYSAELNPPLWELGHIGWFQAWWTLRNPQRLRGHRADPDAPRAPQPGDALYDSSRVAHASRWDLPLPDPRALQDELGQQLHACLVQLADTPDEPDALYFHRLVLLHEDMHHEAAIYMAQALGLPVADPRWQPQPLAGPRRLLPLAGGVLQQGSEIDAGFAFDNECGRHAVALADYAIDSRVLSWAEYLPFVEDGGAAAVGIGPPRYLRRSGDRWETRRWGRWQPLDLREPACHLSHHEALAWCQWAGRRLPTETEWEHAALAAPAGFEWGAVWEWTSSPFAPYPGFVAHPYRDYSAPWFDGRPVLRGASFATQPRMRHPRYRNYFPAKRTDIFAGFRTCAA